MKLNADVDIDMGDRSSLLELIEHVPAAMRNVTPIKRHPSGIYVSDIPYDPFNDMAAIDYTEAEERGCRNRGAQEAFRQAEETQEAEIAAVDAAGGSGNCTRAGYPRRSLRNSTTRLRAS